MNESKVSEATEKKKEVTTGTSVRFKHQNFLSRLGRAEFLLRELKEEDAQNLVSFGIQSETVTNFETIINKVIATNKEQENAKALLKTLSARIRGEMKEMETMYITLKKKIKAEAPLEIWKKYGFADKQ